MFDTIADFIERIVRFFPVEAWIIAVLFLVLFFGIAKQGGLVFSIIGYVFVLWLICKVMGFLLPDKWEPFVFLLMVIICAHVFGKGKKKK